MKLLVLVASASLSCWLPLKCKRAKALNLPIKRIFSEVRREVAGDCRKLRVLQCEVFSFSGAGGAGTTGN